MRISDWSSYVCSSDLLAALIGQRGRGVGVGRRRFGHRCLEFREPSAATLDRVESRGERYGQFGKLVGLDVVLDRKSVVYGKSVSVRVDLGGRRIIKTKT